MKLKVFQPSHVFLDQEVDKVSAEGPEGAFGILPRHLDMAAALLPGILTYWPTGRGESFMAINGGILVKQGDTVLVATRLAVSGELGLLHETVNRFINEMDDRERKTRSAVARLEADFVRRFVEFGKNA